MASTVTVNLGFPVIEPKELGINSRRDNFIEGEIDLLGEHGKVSCVGFEWTHCIFYVADVNRFDVERVGEAISDVEIFPDDIETDFTQSVDNETLAVRSWHGGRETHRGVYAAAAAFAVARVQGLCGNECKVCLENGDVTAWWTDSGINITGPLELVYAL